MERSRRTSKKPTTTPRPRRQRAAAPPADAEPGRKGRPRGDAADTEFARWLDRVTDPSQPDHKTVPQIAEAVGLAPNSLWSIRRGRQGVSLEAAGRLIEYSGGELTVSSFVAA